MPSFEIKDGKIRNPASNRWVSITGKIGIALLAKTSTSPQPNVVKCTFDKILDPKTGICECPSDKINNVTNRCVLKKGLIGQKLLNAQKQKAEITLAPQPRRKNVKKQLHFDELEEDEREEKRDKAPSCKRGQILNPLTLHCVKKTSQIGKSIGVIPTTIQFLPMNYIYGSSSFSIHTSAKYNKQIYIFGDVHTAGSYCDDLPKSIEVSTWITKSIHKNPYFLFDVLLEADTSYARQKFNMMYNPYGVNHSGIPSSLQNTIDHYMTKCDNARICNTENTRIHFCDIRSEYLAPYDFIIDSLLSMINSIEQQQSNTLIVQKATRFMKSEQLIKKQFRAIDVTKLKQLCHVDELLSGIKDKKVERAFQKVLGAFLRHLENFDPDILYDEMDKIVQNGTSYVEKLKLENYRSKKAFFNERVLESLIESQATLMDWYLMATIFSAFPISATTLEEYDHQQKVNVLHKQKQTRIITQKQKQLNDQATEKVNPEPKLIFIHVGEEHAIKYRKVLKILEFTDTNFPLVPTMDRCIDIRKMNKKMNVTLL